MVLMIVAAIAVPKLLLGRLHSEPLWATTTDPVDVGAVRVGDRLFLHGRTTDQVIDPASGSQLLSVPAGRRQLVVGRDLSMVALGNDDATYRDAQGRRRWELRTTTTSRVLAIDHGWVVLADCRRSGDVCGVDPQGRVGWRTDADGFVDIRLAGFRERGRADESNEVSARVAARVVVGRPPGKSDGQWLIDPRGRTLGRLSGSPIAVQDRLAIVWQPATGGAGSCRLAGQLGDRIRWHRELPCDRRPTATAAVLAGRMYLPADPDGDGTWSVRLSDGAVRRFGPLDLGFDDDRSDAVTGIAGDDVVVERDHQQLTGRDPDSGRVLWQYRSGGSRVPGVRVQNGAVVVLTYADRRLVGLSGADPDDEPLQVTVLDARTGRATGRWLTTGGVFHRGGIATSYGYAPGRALLVINSGDVLAVGRS
jgi:outer membrane protein assembly factor BamB